MVEDCVTVPVIIFGLLETESEIVSGSSLLADRGNVCDSDDDNDTVIVNVLERDLLLIMEMLLETVGSERVNEVDCDFSLLSDPVNVVLCVAVVDNDKPNGLPDREKLTDLSREKLRRELEGVRE